MKFLRFLLKLLIAAILLLAVVFGLVWLPSVQTWIAQRYLAAHPRLHTTVGAVTIRPNRIELQDLRIERVGATLTVPHAEIQLPLVASVRSRTALIRKLETHDWTLALHQPGVPPDEPTAAVSEERTPAAQPDGSGTPAISGLLRQLWAPFELPCAFALEQLSAEGDVTFPSGREDTVTSARVTLSGGPWAAGRPAEFRWESRATLTSGVFTGHGTLGVRLEAPRRAVLDSLSGHVAAPAPAGWAAEASLQRKGADVAGQLTVVRDGRELASIHVSGGLGDTRMSGRWKLDVRGADLANVTPDGLVAAETLTGQGALDGDATAGAMHVAGSFRATQATLGTLLRRAGGAPITVDGRFDAVWSASAIDVRQLDLQAVAGEAKIDARALQGFRYEVGSRTCRPANADQDWFETAFHHWPLSDLPAFSGVSLQRATLDGGISVRALHGGYAAHSNAPLTLSAVTLTSERGPLLREVDAVFPLAVTTGPNGWRVEVASLVLSSSGQPLGRVEGQVSRSGGADQPAQFAGKWSVDLDALAAQPLNRAGWIRGRSAAGGFSGTTSGWTDAQIDAKVQGHDPAHSVAGQIGIELEADGTATIQAPLTFDFGATKSDLKLKLSRVVREGGVQSQIELTGEQAELAHVRLLATPLLIAANARWPDALASEPATRTRLRDAAPFWGDWTGRIDVEIARLQAGAATWLDAGGTLRAAPDTLQLEGGRGKIPPPPSTKRPSLLLDGGDDPFRRERMTPTQMRVEGTLRFEANAPEPYVLKASTEREDLDGGTFFAPAAKDEDPPFEGRFAYTATITGQGGTLDALIAQSRREYHFTSTNGILRLLKTNVAAALPQARESRAGNALSGVGTAAGWLFGNKNAFSGSGVVKVGATEDAVLDLRNALAEVGYDQISGTAVREPDGSVRLTELSLTSKDAHLTVTGGIAAAAGRPVRERPLSVSLQLGARGRIAGLLSTAGLASTRNDDQGYLLLNQPVHFGGTLEHPDDREWRDLLVKAALAPAPKK